MKKRWLILLLAAGLALALFIYRDPLLDLLPIDQSRWVEQQGARLLLDEKGDPRTGWYTDGKNTYYFRQDGTMHTGWMGDTLGSYYFDADGTMHTGWLETDGTRRYLGEDGLPFSGLLEQEGKQFFLDEHGFPCAGWQETEDGACYVTREGDIPTGWLETDGTVFYLDSRGHRHTGWLDSDRGRCYFYGDGTMATGWLNVDGKTYYMDENGVMSTGWLHKNGSLYYLDEDGATATGWRELEGRRYYFEESGRGVTGWQDINGKRYYFNQDGAMHTGWLEAGERRYYFRQDGTMARGKLEIDGVNHFFSSAGVNFLLVNPWNKVPEDYVFQPVEACGTRLNPVCQKALEEMLRDCRAAGYRPRVCSGYRDLARQQKNYDRMVRAMGGDHEAAARVVAVPGTSEHQLGLAFDIVDATYSLMNEAQQNTGTQRWLMENSWRYGFILRYPEGASEITGIIYEPWHYRYIGKEIAAELHSLGVCLEVYVDNLTNDGTTCGGIANEP